MIGVAVIGAVVSMILFIVFVATWYISRDVVEALVAAARVLGIFAGLAAIALFWSWVAWSTGVRS